MSLKGAVETLKVLRGKVKDFFVIDKSLSIDGACADAKATGDALSKKANDADVQLALDKKVNITDIVDNLTTNNAKQPLSAGQGLVLMGLIDSINKVAMEDKGVLNPAQMSELDTITGNGIYWLDVSSMTETIFDEGGFIFTHQSDEWGTRIQEYVSESGCKCRRYGDETDDGWSEWEWENPPMKQGVEYRTTERWKVDPAKAPGGYPVYTKLVYCGFLKNNGKTDAEHGCFYDGEIPKYYGEVIRYCGSAYKDYAKYDTLKAFAIPSVYGEQRVDMSVSDWAITISTNYDCSECTAYVQLWYTKLGTV